jgi:hypothetical protein
MAPAKWSAGMFFGIREEPITAFQTGKETM